VLYQNPTGSNKNFAQDQRAQMSVQNHGEDDVADYASTSHQPPPNYRAATGPSPTGKANYI